MAEYFIFVQTDPTTESETQPDDAMDLYAKVDALNKEMTAAGVYVDAGGFKPSKESFKVKFGKDTAPKIVPGPFDLNTETHVCGFWRIKVKDADEAQQWVKKVPFTSGEVVVHKLSADC